MKYYIVFLFFGFHAFAQLPIGFVHVKEQIPDLEVELRYYGNYNFVGKHIDGYYENKLVLTEEATRALKAVQKDLRKRGLSLKVFDGYRPQRAVNNFVTWAHKLNDTINKRIFYPEVKKENLFKEGYIASRSGHSRGSTVDLTIVNAKTKIPLDMGSKFDYFGERSWVNYKNITEKQRANRLFLQRIMNKHGFRSYAKEWWHFTLRHEPFPNDYFDFPIR
ncbi:M15 family metallopeptidase [Gaetbulibacter aestuarii]|uniref:D-alanyl-D-alanine dipeptidase n=1 Tax=Gaetbulibacter aestuarii TaxID=1502358 RepID=A0ABW7N2W8_9FLAO